MRDGTSAMFKKPVTTGVFLILAVAAVASGGRMWISATRVESLFEQLVLKKCSDIARRVEEELQEAAGEERAERLAEIAYDDDRESELRFEWTRVIGAASAAMDYRVAESPPHSYQPRQRGPLTVMAVDEVDFWSFQRLKRIRPPLVNHPSWCRNPIDRFILAGLEARGLTPNPPADDRVLGRRLSFGLTGLAPRPEDITAFESTGDPTAYERFVDRLLLDSSFGERWGRIWLDLARYADSNGYEEDEMRPDAFPYRDFVIWAMNVDLPFDRFVRWQIAGDQLAGDHPMAVAATGFYTAAPLNTFMPQEPERCDELDDMVSTLGTAMLGLTIGCARCHDHRYDPISTREYYGMVAILAETSRTHSYLVPDQGAAYRIWFDPVDERRQEIKEILRARIKEDNISELDYFTEEERDLLRQPIDPTNLEQERLISLCERCLLITDEHFSDDLDPLPQDRERYDLLMAELEELEALLPTRPPMGLTLTGSVVSRIHVLAGGDLNRKEDEVGPGFLAAVTVGHPDWNDDTWKNWAAEGGGSSPQPRLALANWMTDVEHGAGSLAARVIVNRLWQHHFGAGLVTTPNDFGNQGQRPSHPELLEWLASELVDHQWSLKHVHRLMVTSATYRQSCMTTQMNQLDPENRLVGRMVPQRITAEMMRDAMLSAAGNLNREMYGPGVRPPIPRDAVFNTQQEAEETWPIDDQTDRPAVWRRGIYVTLKRTIPVPLMQLFDAPVGSFSCGRRKVTTVPTQALALWNAPFVIKQTEFLAERIVRTALTEEEQVRRLYMLTLSRPPTEQELVATLHFLQDDSCEDVGEQSGRLAALCQVLFMSNEFFYID
jgi:hypothetical protein